jgi:hypothetical protein
MSELFLYAFTNNGRCCTAEKQELFTSHLHPHISNRFGYQEDDDWRAQTEPSIM